MSSRCSALTAKVRQAFPQPGSSQPSTHAPPNLPFFRSLPAHGKPDASGWTGPSCHCAGARRGKEIKLSPHSDAEGEEAAARRQPPALSGGDHYSRCQRQEIDHTCAHSLFHDFTVLLGRYTKISKHVKHNWKFKKKMPVKHYLIKSKPAKLEGENLCTSNVSYSTTRSARRCWWKINA